MGWFFTSYVFLRLNYNVFIKIDVYIMNKIIVFII